MSPPEREQSTRAECSFTWTSGAGGCTGTHAGAEGSCTVTMSAARSLVAELE
jgi:hypothetical protein